MIQRPSGLLSAAAGKLKRSMSMQFFEPSQPSDQPPPPRSQRELTEKKAKLELLKQKHEVVKEYMERMKGKQHDSGTDGAGHDHLKKKIPQRPARKSPIQEQPEQEYQAQLHNQKGLRISIAVAENTPTPPTPPPKDPSPTTVDSTSPTPSTSEDTADRFISLTTTTCTSANQSPLIDRTNLTWNSVLTTILTSARVDAILAAGIRSRAPAHQASSEMGGGKQVLIDMRAVRFVPNFSYPLAGAKWDEKRDLDEWEREKRRGDDEKRRREEKAGKADSSSLFREPSPVSKDHGKNTSGGEDFGWLKLGASPVLKGHEGDTGGGENFHWLKCEASPVLFGIGWEEAEKDLRRLLELEPESVDLKQILSEVNPKYAVQTDRVEVCGSA